MMHVVLQDAAGNKVRLAPQFNLRFFHPAIMDKLAQGLQREYWEPWFAPLLEEKGVSQEQLLEAYQGLFRYSYACADDAYQGGPRDALILGGFLQAHPLAQLVVLAKLGQLYAAAFWLPLREGLAQGEMPQDIARLAEQAQDIQNLLAGQPVVQADPGHV